MKNTDKAEVVNVSGAPSPSTQSVPRSRTADPAPPSAPPGRRAPVEIDAQSGQAFGAATAARARETWGNALVNPGECQLLGNLLGIPGHDGCGQAVEDSQLRAGPYEG